MVPSRKFAVIVLTNKSGETMRKSLNKAMELGLGLKDDEPQKPASVAPPTESEMKEYVGSYSHAPTTWEVFVKDGKLYVKFDGNESALTKSGDRKFTFGAQNQNELVFVPGKNGKIGFLFTELTARREWKSNLDSIRMQVTVTGRYVFEVNLFFNPDDISGLHRLQRAQGSTHKRL